MRIGHGYDAHRFCTGKEMRLGGITIPCEWGFEAHSDGDVLIHALADALLGAAGERDIGNLFPDNDPAYKGIDSRILLCKVCDILRNKGMTVEYADITIIAQKPKLAAYIEPMRRELALQMQIPEDRINVKATTEEKMGFTGRLEGLRVHAICLLNEG
ncbi:MAG: 2-C-methyl-D-erythritol 2,4-cyclodiphosphate synthase [Clostridia bacterium]|nr:2-C-methyl-D-erythritol 2,4-cyclodiphosphate synthase [Clostridia bacterium]